jgi:hypothetical protein
VHVPASTSTVITACGLAVTRALMSFRSAALAVRHGRPSMAELPKKISANDSPTMAWIPQR